MMSSSRVATPTQTTPKSSFPPHQTHKSADPHSSITVFSMMNPAATLAEKEGEEEEEEGGKTTYSVVDLDEYTPPSSPRTGGEVTGHESTHSLGREVNDTLTSTGNDVRETDRYMHMYSQSDIFS